MSKSTISEHDHQCAFVKAFQFKFPNLLIFAIPNGGERSPIIGRKLKKEGVVPGIPDLFIPEIKCFIEMKTERGSLSSPQKVIIPHLESIGYKVIVAKGWMKALQLVEEYVKARKVQNEKA